MEATSGLRVFVIAAVVIASPLTTDATPQAPAPSTAAPSQAAIDAVITGVVNAAKEYEKVFRNLVADETKLVEVFDQSGRVEKRREIVSDLVVYQSSRDAKETAEFRDVRSVDGKAVEKRSKRALDVLTRASHSNSIKKELDQINREGLRYDLGYSFFGLTAGQPGARLADRQALRIEWAGRDQIDGHDVVVIDYQDAAPSRAHSDTKFYERNGFSSSLNRGRLWIDAGTSQVRRARWEIAFVLPAQPEPVPILREESSYTESRFGILVPGRVVYEFFERGKQPKGQPPSFFRAARTTSTYGVFRQFGVATQQTIETPASTTP